MWNNVVSKILAISSCISRTASSPCSEYSDGLLCDSALESSLDVECGAWSVRSSSATSGSGRFLATSSNSFHVHGLCLSRLRLRITLQLLLRFSRLLESATSLSRCRRLACSFMWRDLRTVPSSTPSVVVVRLSLFGHRGIKCREYNVGLYPFSFPPYGSALRTFAVLVADGVPVQFPPFSLGVQSDFWRATLECSRADQRREC